jgi:transposase InsO family protein
LKLEKENWPKDIDVKDEDIDSSDLELKVVQVHKVQEVDPVFNFQRFSKYQKMLRTAGWMIRFIHKKIQKVSTPRPYLTVIDLRKAEILLVKLAQQQSFHEEVRSLNGGKFLPKTSKLLALEPFLDDFGLMRVRGRLGNCGALREEQKHPLIMDSHHHMTKLLLQWYHEMCGHQGQRTVANEIRQKFWILDCMSAVKKAFRECPKCKITKAKPSIVIMADLPDFRTVANIRPFTNTGMDYFGPLTIKIGRRVEKRWGVIFTCLSTRAVNLQVAASLNTDSAIMAIMRLSNQRNRPSTIYSDNGTNFHGANNELLKALKELDPKEMTERMLTKSINWIFNPPAAPHMGGVWERLVGSVKRTIEGIMKERTVTDEVLYTVFTEVENILNSRPLTKVSVDPNDPESLTPNHFLKGYSSGVGDLRKENSPWGEFDDTDLFLRKAWRTSQRLADHFWSRWIKEYLPTLTKRVKWMKSTETIKVDDIVIVVDDQAPRNTWNKGRVTAVFPGRDGRVRVAEIKTAAGSFRRPVAKLCKLNIKTEDVMKTSGAEVPSAGGRMSGDDENQVASPPSSRSCASAR